MRMKVALHVSCFDLSKMKLMRMIESRLVIICVILIYIFIENTVVCYPRVFIEKSVTEKYKMTETNKKHNLS